MVIILDTFPASSICKLPDSRRRSISDQCREWIIACEAAGHRTLVPAIAYYEVLRELEQREAHRQIDRLRSFCLQVDRFVPLVTAHLEKAAQLWGDARRAGMSTADSKALDGDVILAAQTLSLNITDSDYVVATTNPAHLSRYVAAEMWSNINP